METFLLLHTERPTRRVFAAERPGRLLFASDEVREEDRAVYDECVRLPPPERVADTLRALARLDFDRVVVQTEYALLPGSLLAAERGLPAPPVEAAHRCTNKWLSRRALARAGVPVPSFALAETPADVRAFAERYPIVLKPVASTLGRGVARVACEEEVDGAVDRLRRFLPSALDVVRLLDFERLAGLEPGCDPTRQFLVEEWLEGEPVETDGLMFGEETDFFAVTGQVLSRTARPFLEGYMLPLPDGGHRALTEAALRAHGLRDAGFSVEFRGEAVIEVNGRLGEDDGFPDLFRSALGIAPILKWLSGDRRRREVSGGRALAYRNRYAGGRVRCVEGNAEVEALVRPGEALRDLGHPDFSPHLAYALASHAGSAREAYEVARARVEGARFEIEGEGP